MLDLELSHSVKMVRLVGLEPTRPKARGLNPVSIPISLQAHYLERIAGNDPASLVWQTSVIPLYDTRIVLQYL